MRLPLLSIQRVLRVVVHFPLMCRFRIKVIYSLTVLRRVLLFVELKVLPKKEISFLKRNVFVNGISNIANPPTKTFQSLYVLETFLTLGWKLFWLCIGNIFNLGLEIFLSLGQKGLNLKNV